MSGSYVIWPFYGPKMNRLAQIMAESGALKTDNLAPANFCELVSLFVGPINPHQAPEHFADIALHRIAQ